MIRVYLSTSQGKYVIFKQSSDIDKLYLTCYILITITIQLVLNLDKLVFKGHLTFRVSSEFRRIFYLHRALGVCSCLTWGCLALGHQAYNHHLLVFNLSLTLLVILLQLLKSIVQVLLFIDKLNDFVVEQLGTINQVL